MNLLFLEIDRVLVKDFSNNLDVQLNSVLSNTSCGVVNKLIEQHDFYIVLTSKSLDNYTEKEAFSSLSKIGLPVDRFLTKLTIGDQDVLNVISEYLAKRSDVDLYFILNNVNNISNYSPYVYSSIKVLTSKDLDIINTQLSIINNNQQVAEEYSSEFFKAEMKKSLQKEYEGDMIELYKDEVRKLITNDPEKFGNKAGLKYLKSNYGKYIEEKDLLAIYKACGIRSFSHTLYTKVIPFSIFLTLVIILICFFIFKSLLVFIFSVPIVFLIYSFASEIAESRHKGL